MLKCESYWRDERLDILDKEFELVLVLRLGPGLTSTSPQPKISIYSHKLHGWWDVKPQIKQTNIYSDAPASLLW